MVLTTSQSPDLVSKTMIFITIFGLFGGLFGFFFLACLLLKPDLIKEQGLHSYTICGLSVHFPLTKASFLNHRNTVLMSLKDYVNVLK